MTSQVSRLDRQVILLETGSTQVVRSMAADQLGDLAKQHPEDILLLLSRVYPYLLSKKWETRVTAARAVGGIVANAEIWNPNKDDEDNNTIDINVKNETDIIQTDEFQENAKIKIEKDMQLKLEEIDEDELLDGDKPYYSLSNWNLYELFKTGKTLLASSINDFNDNNDINASRKKLIKTDQNNNSNDDDDSNRQNSNNNPNISDVKQEQQQQPNSNGGSKKSARMLAMAKRKQRMQTKNISTKPVNLTESSVSKNLLKSKNGNNNNNNVKNESSTLVNPKMEITEQSDSNKIMLEAVVEPILEKHERVAGLVWQFQGIYELLLKNLAHDNWEIRHGAALGLRELMKKHASSVSRLKGKSKAENDNRNFASLDDLATRLLTIFALDRFGDYIHDTVVAPVRESAAQTLATLLIHLNDELSMKIFNALQQLVFQDFINTQTQNFKPEDDEFQQPQPNIQLKVWEATHGGLLGILYFASIKQDFLKNNSLMDSVVSIVLYGLNQADDDVQSVSASILSPITDDFVKLETSKIDLLITTIWNSLTHLDDDLSSSVGSIMDLLAKLCKYEETLNCVKAKANQYPAEWSFKYLVPKLFPFLRHSISSVRQSVLNLLLAFLSINDDSTKGWINGKIFRLIFQNIILEQNPKILQSSFDVYTKLLNVYKSMEAEKTLDHLLSKHLQPMLHLLNTPIGENDKNYSMESQFILKPSQHYKLHPDKKRSLSEATIESDIPAPKNSEHVNIDAPMIAGDVMLLGKEIIINTRVMGAKAFGLTLAMLQESTLQSFVSNVLVRCLDLPFATPRMLAGIILTDICSNWSLCNVNNPTIPSFIFDVFGSVLNEQLTNRDKLPPFRELVPSLKALRTQCQTLFSTFVDVGLLPKHKLPSIAIIVQGETEAGPEAFGIETAEKVHNEYYEKMFRSLGNSYKLLAKKPLEDARYRILLAIEAAKEAKLARECSILSNYASVIIQFDGLPEKLNPIIRSLMDSIKEEKNLKLQEISGNSVIHLINKLLSNNKAGVANKVVKNLCGFLCVDTQEVPEFSSNEIYKENILTLVKETAGLGLVDDARLKRITDEAHIKRRGGLYVIGEIFSKFGDNAFDIEQLKTIILEPIKETIKSSDEDINSKRGQSLVDAMGILRAIYMFMSPFIQENQVLPCFPNLLTLLRSKYSVLRYSAARTFGDLAMISHVAVMTFVIENVLPLMNNAGSVTDRQGATELIYHLSVSMGTDILPYVIFLIVPLLGRMSDTDPDVRGLATSTFASIIKLVPLEEGIADPEGLPESLMVGRERERDFIQQMMDPSKAKPFKLPVAIKATLRKYQQEGVNWLAFLNKYHLHGILCDDMGLGKTLQTICIIASDQYLRQEDFKETKSVETRPLPSLIICPPSLTGHWENEFEVYSPFLNVVVYAGGPSTRQSLKERLADADIIVTSYDVARNDLSVITKYDYNYCVLDEGHIIKNSQSKLAKAVKSIAANHRLILTGTPIQNNVVELWSLFDFLMPGFLGTEKMFQERFAKPIAASRNSKSSSKEQEQGTLALEALHKQVLPFMLRRLKEDVLSDLPPKIIQDYYCELSDLQKQLYKDFANKQKNVVEKDIQNTADVENKQHIFQALQYMRKLCNHPSLILSENHPQLKQVDEYLKQTGLGLHDIVNAPKLGALRNLLFECGIGEDDMDKKSTDQLVPSNTVISQHRALIFCQLKDMLDLVENDLFKKYMPSVTYMRLDGSVDPRDRQKVVRKFNEDPSIDCLLLTTKVGGLGLNLTGADTVIFIEHDWNPMNDLQAMDRAHRLGQKKVVNVYRIITKGTLEEKIMGLQKFKMNIASTVVNQQNNGLASMDTHQLLDLFDTNNVPNQDKEETPVESKAMDDIANETGLSGKAKEALGGLKELWDSSQYEDEYNLDNFIKALR
ncbi:hypothetical protein Kpol_1048p54 [Vanderwaltozyma polyspora DSM 70294]|uniref:TATA-binding protein-associated factor mot1 n=1 Tax=Vanderwaltozyma polyspora (strain ATCC 22028 / DSM 70294 / BCRC 21397 / CBS 2163 / NBRC 10782 / NRRL Y-8283 / UCD 57-17) TaxID=436907 RepID=A7TGL6_VANPO|nr:uncharacterized protein Kpol_1048p54 [Vanderwaltozyma polyspora DSM 70294]EDO18623.1 hypothetical protein Kpol_1048p54 [Vanderwaltozyma polyspora DSM 70294]